VTKSTSRDRPPPKQTRATPKPSMTSRAELWV